jgi:hypothetical protein
MNNMYPASKYKVIFQQAQLHYQSKFPKILSLDASKESNGRFKIAIDLYSSTSKSFSQKELGDSRFEIFSFKKSSAQVN